MCEENIKAFVPIKEEDFPRFYVCDEMKKLREGLDERGIVWEDATSEYKDGLWICRTHFWYKGNRVSVIHGHGSYGGYDFITKDQQLLEYYDGNSEPTGWLTADGVFELLEGK